ncbi:Bromodomain protein [Cryptosporidium meleagridis]|uniref:Bromodomain protein n=1 Tax=Cryptosporidium meleagridis TaxID=93969 RepID=A0A2P4YZN1_9CRYT|nr:Bromodomain protein [Cryptosporidium meleagridis]
MDSGVSKGISSSIRRKLSILLETLRKDPNFELFIYPIDPIRDGCLDYFEVIKTPMDLITVSNKLLNDQYKNIHEIFQEIELIFSNCREYNTSPLCKHIIELCNKSEHRFLQEWTKLGFSDKSTKKKLEELSKELCRNQKFNISSSSSSNNNNTENGSNSNQCHSNSNQKNVVNPSISNNHGKGSQKNSPKVNPSTSSYSSPNPSSSSKGNTSRVVLKIDKDNISTNTCENNVNNKRQKSESSKKFASNNNNIIPLKKRKDSDGFLESSNFIINNSNDNNNENSNQSISNDTDFDWRNECLRILNLLRKEQNSFLFENPVLESNDLTEETKSRYKEVIPEVCDYITIEKRLHNKSNSKRQSTSNQKRKSATSNSKSNQKIENPHEFERLVRLIFSNCMIFNPNSGECKWIYDSAKQTLNKFNNLWNKSNVFFLYANSQSTSNYFNPNSSQSSSKQNLVDTKDNQSDTSVGFSISTTNFNKNASQFNNNSSLYNPNATVKNKFNINSRNMISSFNKIITQWNNYSIIWRQFILNKSNNNTNNENKINTGIKMTNNTGTRKSSRSNNKNNSSHKIFFKICPRNNNTIINQGHKNIQEFFDSNFDNNLPDSNSTIINSNNKFELTKNLDYNEYVFPIKIYSSNFIKSNHNIMTNLSHHFHNVIKKSINNNSIIYIYCFKPYNSHLPEINFGNNINSISNQNYFAYTDNNGLINKYIELRIKIPKSVNNFIIPMVDEYIINNHISALNVNIIINNIIENDIDSILEIYFGDIL